jgi:hypothetical protein
LKNQSVSKIKKKQNGYYWFSLMNLLCTNKIKIPKTTPKSIKKEFKTPSVAKEILSMIVDIINPEFLITL